MTESRGTPLFSVIIPVFNGGAYLARAVRSALRQSCPDFELIVVDDGSTDDAIDDVRRSDDPRIRVLRQTNHGAPSACNAGLKIARGRYVAFLDHDDLWAETKLARHREAFEADPDVLLTFTWTSFIGEDDQNLGVPRRRWHGRVTFEQVFVDNVIGATSSVAVRRDVIGEAGAFDVSLPLTYDLDLYLRVLQAHQAAALAIPDVLTFYRRHSIQMSRDWRALQNDWRGLLDKFRLLAPAATARLETAATVNMTRYCAYIAYERRQFGDGCRLLNAALRLSPSGFLRDQRNWALYAACIAGLLPRAVHRRMESMAGLRTFSAPSTGRSDTRDETA